MQITEIYKSLQGESTYAGMPCVFVRLTGCNLRCTWCDTEYSFYGGKKISPEQVFDEVEHLSPSGGLVEITGGEPMLQERELLPLMQHLADSGYTVLLETSGERPLARCSSLRHSARKRLERGMHRTAWWIRRSSRNGCWKTTFRRGSGYRFIS